MKQQLPRVALCVCVWEAAQWFSDSRLPQGWKPWEGWHSEPAVCRQLRGVTFLSFTKHTHTHTHNWTSNVLEMLHYFSQHRSIFLI